jgi:hypothetical protein
MKTIYRIFILSLLLIIISFTANYGQVSVNKVGQTGMNFLSVEVGARTAAMGDAIVALDNNSESIFSNPAAITNIDHQFDFSIGYNSWIADIKHDYGSFVYKDESLGSIGASFIYVDYGQLDGTIRSDSDPKGYIETGTFSPKAYVIGLTYARAVSQKFSFGLNFKYAIQDLGAGFVGTGTGTEQYKKESYSLSVPALDVGAIYYTGFKDLKLGVSIINISPEKSFINESAPLPFTLRFGISADIFKSIDLKINDQFILAVEVLHPRDYGERVHIGGEYVYQNLLALRGGYKSNHDEDNYSAGAGLILWNNFRVDYSFNSFGNLNSVNRISLGFMF